MLGKLFLFALIVEILKWIWYFVSMEFLRKCSVDPWKCLNAGQAPQIFHFTKNRKDFVFKIQQSEQKFVIRHAHTFELRTSFTLMEASQVSKALSVSFFFYSARTMHNHNHNRCRCSYNSVGCRSRIQTTRRSILALMGVYKNVWRH